MSTPQPQDDLLRAYGLENTFRKLLSKSTAAATSGLGSTFYHYVSHLPCTVYYNKAVAKLDNTAANTTTMKGPSTAKQSTSAAPTTSNTAGSGVPNSMTLTQLHALGLRDEDTHIAPLMFQQPPPILDIVPLSTDLLQKVFGTVSAGVHVSQTDAVPAPLNLLSRPTSEPRIKKKKKKRDATSAGADNPDEKRRVKQARHEPTAGNSHNTLAASPALSLLPPPSPSLANATTSNIHITASPSPYTAGTPLRQPRTATAPRTSTATRLTLADEHVEII